MPTVALRLIETGASRPEQINIYAVSALKMARQHGLQNVVQELEQILNTKSDFIIIFNIPH